MKCSVIVCPSEATSAVALNVPATGFEINAHKPLQIVLGLKLCDKCREELEPAEWLNDKLKAIFTIQAGKGGVPPDFARAFFSRIGFDSEEWKVLTGGKK